MDDVTKSMPAPSLLSEMRVRKKYYWHRYVYATNWFERKYYRFMWWTIRWW